jgi:hypothetical protein
MIPGDFTRTLALLVSRDQPLAARDRAATRPATGRPERLRRYGPDAGLGVIPSGMCPRSLFGRAVGIRNATPVAQS